MLDMLLPCLRKLTAQFLKKRKKPEIVCFLFVLQTTSSNFVILSSVFTYILNQMQNPILSTNWSYLYTDSWLLNQGAVEKIVGRESGEHRTINNESDGIDNDKPNFRSVGHYFELTKITGNEKFCGSLSVLNTEIRQLSYTIIFNLFSLKSESRP